MRAQLKFILPSKPNFYFYFVIFLNFSATKNFHSFLPFCSESNAGNENRFRVPVTMIVTGTRSTIWAGFHNANRAGYPRLSLLLLHFSPSLCGSFFSRASYTPSLATMNKEKLMKMASAVRTGGKGSVRRYVVLVYLFSSSAVLCLFCFGRSCIFRV